MPLTVLSSVAPPHKRLRLLRVRVEAEQREIEDNGDLPPTLADISLTNNTLLAYFVNDASSPGKRVATRCSVRIGKTKATPTGRGRCPRNGGIDRRGRGRLSNGGKSRSVARGGRSDHIGYWRGWCSGGWFVTLRATLSYKRQVRKLCRAYWRRLAWSPSAQAARSGEWPAVSETGGGPSFSWHAILRYVRFRTVPRSFRRHYFKAVVKNGAKSRVSFGNVSDFASLGRFSCSLCWLCQLSRFVPVSIWARKLQFYQS